MWGIREVSLVIEGGGMSYGPISETIVIQPTGSCAEDASVIFIDDFESGDASAWAGTVP